LDFWRLRSSWGFERYGDFSTVVVGALEFTVSTWGLNSD
jgi:hypothetical protein